ncbi:hypothetical protein ACU4GI_07095 [Cupriavidus basilensis]
MNANVKTPTLSERLGQPVPDVLEMLTALLAGQGRWLRTGQPLSAPADFDALRVAFDHHSGTVGSVLKKPCWSAGQRSRFPTGSWRAASSRRRNLPTPTGFAIPSTGPCTT